MDEAVKLIRSLLVVSNDGLLIQQINKEYRNEVGEWIPFKKFGFNTLEEFLRASGEFTGKKTVAGTIVSVKGTGKSAHIIQMRQMQSVSASERKRRKKSASAKSNASLARPLVRSGPRRNELSTAPKVNKIPQRRQFRQNPSSSNTIAMQSKQQPTASQYQQRESVPKPTTSNESRPIVNVSPAKPKQPAKTELHSRLIPKLPIFESKTFDEQPSSQRNDAQSRVSLKLLAHRPTISEELPSQQNGLHLKLASKQAEIKTLDKQTSAPNESESPVKQPAKIDLYSRLARKQPIFESKTPNEQPSTQQSGLHLKLPSKQSELRTLYRSQQYTSFPTTSFTPIKTPPKSLLISDLHAQFVSKQRVEEPMPNDSVKYTPMSTPLKPSDGINNTPSFDMKSKQMNLHSRLAMKQLSPVQGDAESTSSSTVPSRAKLLRLLEKLQEPAVKNLQEPKKSSAKQRLVTFDLKTVIIGRASSNENGESKPATETIEEMPKLISNIHARLQPKQMSQNSVMNQLSEKVSQNGFLK